MCDRFWIQANVTPVVEARHTPGKVPAPPRSPAPFRPTMASSPCSGEGASVSGEMDLAFEAGDFEKGISVLEAFGLFHMEVAFNGCDAIWELATDELNAAKLGNVGACEVVVNILRTWGRVDMRAAWNGCSAIANLAVENHANRVRLGAAGACEAVLDALRAWGMIDKDVGFYGRRAIYCLGKHEANKLKLLELGVSSVVLASKEPDFKEQAEDEG
jgi:hypothetical protein